MLTNDDLYKVYDWSTVVTSVILVALYVVALRMIRENTECKFVSKLVVLMIISNVGAALMIPCNNIVVKKGELTVIPKWVLWFVLLQFIAGMMRDVSFNISHWVFSY
jgi:hypothetical protein